MIIWSYGGGTQSVAIAVLIIKGELPIPDLIIFADTSREASETWIYTENHMQPLLATVGRQVEVAPHSLATVDLYTSNGKLLIPAFTEKGKLLQFCSHEWKRRVVQRYARQQGVKTCDLWIGISVDEYERMGDSDVKWMKHRYPLCFDIQIDRAGCRALVERFGLPTPPRSSCWMCPNRNDTEWQHLRDNWPEDWGKACKMDIMIRERDQRGGVWLHKSLVPLAQANIEDKREPLPLFQCDSGFCYI